jgi:molybdopterin-binding protein
MTLSARNQLNGTVEEVQLGGTRRSAEAMALMKGDSVKVVIKSTEVMLQMD